MATIYLHPVYRGRGIGTLLLRLIEEHARGHMHAICRELRITLSHSVNSVNQAAKNRLEDEGYLSSHNFWRLVLDMGEIMSNNNSSEQDKLRIDMVLDAENAADIMWWNQGNGVSFVQQYTEYQKELRPGIDEATLAGLPSEDILLSR